MEITVSNILYFYLIAVNVLAFSVYGMDKRKAKANQWRVPESQLLLLAVIGGSVGALLGMRTFHHKTRKPKFYIGVPVILGLQICLVVFLRGYFRSVVREKRGMRRDARKWKGSRCLVSEPLYF